MMNIINNISTDNIISIIALMFSIFSMFYSNKNKKEIEVLKKELSEDQYKFIKNYHEQRKIIKELNELFLYVHKNFVNFYVHTKNSNRKGISDSLEGYISGFDDINHILEEKSIIIKKTIYNKSKNLIEEYDYVISEIQFSPEEALSKLVEYKKKINNLKKDLEKEFRNILGSE